MPVDFEPSPKVRCTWLPSCRHHPVLEVTNPAIPANASAAALVSSYSQAGEPGSALESGPSTGAGRIWKVFFGYRSMGCSQKPWQCGHRWINKDHALSLPSPSVSGFKFIGILSHRRLKSTACFPCSRISFKTGKAAVLDRDIIERAIN